MILVKTLETIKRAKEYEIEEYKKRTEVLIELAHEKEITETELFEEILVIKEHYKMAEQILSAINKELDIRIKEDDREVIIGGLKDPIVLNKELTKEDIKEMEENVWQ